MGSKMNTLVRSRTFMETVNGFYWGFPGGTDGKESACNVADQGSIPGLGKSPGEGNGYPLQDSCLGNSIDREPGGLQSMGSKRVRHD